MQKTLSKEDVQKLFKLIDFDTDDEQSLQIFIDFANVVAAAERNRTWTQDHWTEYERSIAATEREACAKVCDDLRDEDGYGAWNTECAAAIRARGQD